MTTHTIKTWFEDGRIIEQVIPESEIYKREWVGLTYEELHEIYQTTGTVHYKFALVEAKLKDKNT